MKIDHIPKMRDAFVPPPKAYLIIGDGEAAGGVKSIPFGRGLNSDLIKTIEMIKRGQNNTEVAETHLVVQEAYKQQGYKLLYDAYEEEGRLDDWYQWLEFQSAAKVPRNVPLNKYGNGIVPGFPDELLPKYCTELRKTAAPSGKKWEPKLPAKGVTRKPTTKPKPEHGSSRPAEEAKA